MSTTSTILEDGTLFAYNWLNEKLTVLHPKNGIDQYLSLNREEAKALGEFIETYL